MKTAFLLITALAMLSCRDFPVDQDQENQAPSIQQFLIQNPGVELFYDFKSLHWTGSDWLVQEKRISTTYFLGKDFDRALACFLHHQCN